MQTDGKILINGGINGFITRLNADGTLDTSFQPNPDGLINAIAVQPDGKIIIGGSFTQLQPTGDLNPTLRNSIARLNADGTVDTGFDPNVNDSVNCIALQPDGSILFGGRFTTLQPNGASSPTTRNRIARVYADGSLDTSFDPSANNIVNCIVIQPEGSILLGGNFTSLSPNGAGSTTRNRIARVDAFGGLDMSFDPNVDSTVQTLVLQPDGSVIAGGSFSNVQPNGAPASTSRSRIARFQPDGSLDTGFDPKAAGTINSAVLQTDGKIIIGGTFFSLRPNGAPTATTRHRIARLNADGTLDGTFDPNANSTVYALSLQADGRIIVAGSFSSIGGISAPSIARLDNDAATQSLDLFGSSFQWLRGGSSPEVNSVTFDISTDGGLNWNTLNGTVSRVAGGWSISHILLPNSGRIRATAAIFGGQGNGSSGLIQVSNSFFIAPVNHAPVGANNVLTINENSAYTFSPEDFGFTDPNDFPQNNLNRIEITTLPDHGTLTLNGLPVTAGDFATLGDTLVFTPANGEFGSAYATFTFQVEDDGGTANGGVNLDFSPKTMQFDVDSIVTGTAPGIVAQSSSQTVNAGTNVILTVTATGTAPLSYFWRKNGSNLVGANTDTFTLANVLRTNAGTYTVVITNAVGGVTSAPVVVTIIDPAIARQPTNLAVASGASAQFEADAAGTATNRFQWYCVSNDVAHTTVKLTGKTNNILLLTGVKTNNAGGYFAIVTNQLAAPNSATSTVAQLTVAAAPTFTTLPLNVSVVMGNKAAFSVVISAATTLPVAYQWAENGHVITGATNASLTIAHATEIGNNYYNCTVTNIGGSATSTTNAHGKLTVTADVTKPVVGMTYPTIGRRFTNNVVYSYLGSSLTASNVLLLGTVTDNGWITNVTIKQTYPTVGLPVTATLSQSLPGSAVYSNAVVLVDGTNSFTITAQDASWNSNTLTRSVFFLHPATLTVQTNGYGTTAPVGVVTYGKATNGAPLELGRTFSIKATAAPGNVFSNWTDGAGLFQTNTAQLNFKMVTNLVLNANFMTNPIIAHQLNGQYNGLFYETNGLDQADVKVVSAGLVQNLMLSTNGTFTGTLKLQGKSYTFATNLDFVSGTRTFTLSRTRDSRNPVTLALSLDLTGVSKQITGTIACSLDGWTSPLAADQAVYNAANHYPLAKLYTIKIERPDATGLTAPGGEGWAAITTTALGMSVLSGRVADGSLISQSMPISAAGSVPVYTQLYNGLGVAMGLLHVTSTNVSGALAWIRPATNNPATYVTGFTNTAAFSNDLAVTGTVYVPPTLVSVFASTNTLTLEVMDNEGFSRDNTGANLLWHLKILNGKLLMDTNYSNPTNHIVISQSGNPSADFGLAMYREFGGFNFTYVTTGDGGTKILKGMADQTTTNGFGYFIGVNQVGTFTLHP